MMTEADECCALVAQHSTLSSSQMGKVQDAIKWWWHRVVPVLCPSQLSLNKCL